MKIAGKKQDFSNMNTSGSKESDLYNESSTINSILESRINQMIALTLPSDKNKLEILSEINEIKSTSEKISSFLDFMIGCVTSLTVDLNGCQTELLKTKQELSSCKVVSESSHCENEDKKEKKRIQKEEVYVSDYNKCLQLLDSKKGKLEESINNIIKENDRLSRTITQDRSLLIKQNEELRKQIRINKQLMKAQKEDFYSQEIVHHSGKEDIKDIENINPLRKEKCKLNEIKTALSELRHEIDNIGSHGKHKRNRYEWIKN